VSYFYQAEETGMKSYTVSIIIITCNRPFLLDHCIQRVLDQSNQRKEIIVIDSSSNDESEELISRYPDIRYVHVRGQRNNMPQARNEGIQLSTGELIAFIDDDSMVQPGWLDALVEVYQDDSIGAAGGRVIAMPEPYCNQWKGEPHLTVAASGRVVAKDAGLISTYPIEVDHLIGCNMSFRRKALEMVGGFDQNYTQTNLREETDMCVRVKKVGWRIIFHPSIAVMHFSARSLQPYFLERPTVQFSNGRNGAYFALKHFGITPRTLAGQLADTGKSCGRAMYFTGLFSIGVAAQILGRTVGMYEAVRFLSQKQRSMVTVYPVKRLTSTYTSTSLEQDHLQSPEDVVSGLH
jgi:GT2 family glycosyltransferase